MPVGFINEPIASRQSDKKLLAPMNGIILFTNNSTPSHKGRKSVQLPTGVAAPSVLMVTVLGNRLDCDIPAS
jgi:hypothetical protein